MEKIAFFPRLPCRVENTPVGNESSSVKIASCFYSCWTEQMQESLPAMKLNVCISLQAWFGGRGVLPRVGGTFAHFAL